MGSSLHHHVHCVELPNPVCSDTPPSKRTSQNYVLYSLQLDKNCSNVCKVLDLGDKKEMYSAQIHHTVKFKFGKQWDCIIARLSGYFTEQTAVWELAGKKTEAQGGNRK